MKLTVVVSGAVGRLAGNIKTNRHIQKHRGRSKATKEADAIVNRFNRRTRLAEAGGNINIAVNGVVKIIFGADQGENFSGAGNSN